MIKYNTLYFNILLQQPAMAWYLSPTLAVAYGQG